MEALQAAPRASLSRKRLPSVRDSHRLRPAVAGFLLHFSLTLTSASAQEGQQRPVFRAGVDAVAVDVMVVDGQGRPVRGLTVDDFTLLVDGRPRALVSLEYVPMTSGETPAPPAMEARGFSTNVGAQPGRLILIVVDRENVRTGGGRPAMAAAQRFLDRLSPNDRVGLFTLPPGGPRIAFTSDKARIRAALNGVTGLGTETLGMYNVGLAEALAIRRGDSSVLADVIDRECAGGEGEPACPSLVESEARAVAEDARRKTQQFLTELGDLIDRLKPIDSPKTLVLISQGLAQDVDTLGTMQSLSRAAAAARVTLYAIQIDTLLADASRPQAPPTPMQDLGLLTEGMGALAGMTRGALFRAGASFDSALARVERELTGYYLLAFEVEPTDRDGRPHRIAVRCRSGDGTVVRSRSEFVIPQDRVETDELDDLAWALRAPFPSTGLPIEAATYTLLDPNPDRQNVLLAAQIGRDPLPPGSVSLAWAVLDARGNIVANQVQDLTSPEAGGAPLRYVQSIPLEQGAYTWKLAAKDEAGHTGSVEHPFDVAPRKAGEWTFSDLVLVDSATVSGEPLTSGMTSSRAGLRAYVEIGSRGSALPSGFGVSFDVLPRNDEKTLTQVAGTVNDTAEPGRWIAEGSIAFDSLPPESYRLRASLAKDGRPWFHIERPFQWSPAEEAARLSVEDLPPGPVRDYAEILESYRSGGVDRAAPDLAGWGKESLEEATQQIATRARSDDTLKWAALLHTEVILRSGEEETLHLQAAQRLLAAIQDASLRARLERQWYLIVAQHFLYLGLDWVAGTVLEIALERFPEDEDLLLLAGAVSEASAWTRKDEKGPWLDDAKKYYRRLLKANPDHVEAHIRSGHIFKLEKRLDDALREIEWSLSHEPTPELTFVAHLLRGDIHRTRNAISMAIEDYRAALAIDPRSQAAATGLSYSLFQAGDPDGSRDVILRFFDGADRHAYFGDAWWRYLRGDSERAAARLKRIREDVQ